MVVAARGAYGTSLARTFHMDEAPAFVFQKLESAEIAVTQIKCDRRNNGFTAPIPVEDAFLITLQIRRVEEHEFFQDGRHAETGPLAAGSTCIYDLRRNPMEESISPFHSLHFYVPRKTLNAMADSDEAPRIDDFDNSPGFGVNDPIIRELGQTLLPAFNRPEEANVIFVDHISSAIAAFSARKYGRGPAGSRTLRPHMHGLSRDHDRRIKEFLREHLDGAVSLAEVAQACGLSHRDFADAFQRSNGVPFHRWMLIQRVERAKELLLGDGTFAEIARSSGFVTERHLRRVFSRVTGVSLNDWRTNRYR
jgi:AraC family transcriptional regulator